MILKYKSFGKQNKGSKSVVCARVHNSFSGGAFRKAKYEKLRWRKSEGKAEGGRGGNSASPERQFLSKKFRDKFRISHQKRVYHLKNYFWVVFLGKN